MQIEEVPVPAIRPTEVLVKIAACGIVPNLHNILTNWVKWFPQKPLPKLPAIFGLDPAGVIEAVGDQVYDFKPGDRVYVNPARYCGSCRACRAGNTRPVQRLHLQRLLWLYPRSPRMFEDYPYGGLCEYMPAPQYSLVRLPHNLSFETAARLGYLGTAYSALLKADVGPGSTVLINGITGTLGLGAAHGLGHGRAQDPRHRAQRDPIPAGQGPGRPRQASKSSPSAVPDSQWTERITAGEGLDAVIDAMGPGAPAAGLTQARQTDTRRRAGEHRRGSRRSTAGPALDDGQRHPAQRLGLVHHRPGQNMADMVESGVLDLSFSSTRMFALEDINQAITGIENRQGGFSNYAIRP